MSVNRRNDGERRNGPMLVFEEMSPASLLSPSFRINAERSPAVNVAPIQSAWWPFLKGSPPKFCRCHGVTQVSCSVIIPFPLTFKCLKSDLTKAKILYVYIDNVLFFFKRKFNQPLSAAGSFMLTDSGKHGWILIFGPILWFVIICPTSAAKSAVRIMHLTHLAVSWCFT